MENTETKVCSRCDVVKPINEYHIKNDRYVSQCVKCEEKMKQYRLINREKEIERHKKYRNENKLKMAETKKQYRIVNRDKIREYKNTPQRRLSNRLRNRISMAISEQYGNKAYKSIELLGCSIDECRKYLESKFLPGMTWENIGEWHIDHIIPCASFDLTKPEEQLKCFHYTNLQPLWEFDNLSKGSRR